MYGTTIAIGILGYWDTTIGDGDIGIGDIGDIGDAHRVKSRKATSIGDMWEKQCSLKKYEEHTDSQSPS